MKKIKDILTGIFIGMVIGGIGVGAYMQLTTIVAAPAAKEIGEPTETKECEKIIMYKDREKKKKQLGLPDEVEKDDRLMLTAVTRVVADDLDHVVSALYDSDSGKVNLFDAPQPRPWLKFVNRPYIGYHYGLKDKDSKEEYENEDAKFVHRLTLGSNFVNIKKIKFDAKADLDSDGSYFVGVGGNLRF